MKMINYLPYLLIISILLADILIYAGLIKMFFNGNETIIAGVIAFIGAVIGGIITYFGVNKTLEHRDREVFLNNATEKLMYLEILYDTYSEPLNKVFLLENSMKDENKSLMALGKIRGVAEKIQMKLKEDKEKMYRSMEYDAIEILSFHQKTLEGITRKDRFSVEDAQKCVEKIRDIFQVFHVSKEQLEQKYRVLKKKNKRP